MLQNVPAGAARRSFTPYQNLLLRVHRQINSSVAQLGRQTIIVRQTGESTDDWDSFLEQLDVEESVRVTHIDQGAARLDWTNQHFSLVAFG